MLTARPMLLVALLAPAACVHSRTTPCAGPGPTFAEIESRFGVIETLAGAGRIRDKTTNGWLARYEGGPATEAELSRPHTALTDGGGNLFIVDKLAHAVRRVAPDGRITTAAGTGDPGDDGDGPGPARDMRLSLPNGLWVHDDGTLFVLDLGNDKVRRITPDGQMSTLFAIDGAAAGRGLWVSDDEQLAYVSAGSELKSWTPKGGVHTLAAGFTELGNLAVDRDGTVIVTDRRGHRVYRVDRNGNQTAIAGNGTTEGGGDGQPALETGLDEPRGVWLDPEGGTFIATHHGGKVWYLDGCGVIHLFVDGDNDNTHAGDGEPVRSPGPKISEARAVTMDHDGNILITESDYGFVRIVRRRR